VSSIGALARQAWDEVDKDTGGRFDLAAVRDRVMTLIDFDAMAEDLVASAINGAVDREDTRRKGTGQLSIFADDPDDYAQLGRGRRVRRDVMVLADVLTEAAIEAEAMAAHAASFAQRQHVRAALQPYLSVPNTTWAMAKEAYRIDHPEES
jgi:hypothetical protein